MKTLIHHLLLPVLLIAGIGAVHGQNSKVPNGINYQGVLTDSTGAVVAPTAPENKNIEFRIYSTANGGTALWGEVQTVTVYKGNFSVILGNGAVAQGGPATSGANDLAALLANPPGPDLFFGIKPEHESEFTPRQKLLSSAFALRAKTAESVSAAANSPASSFNSVTTSLLTMNGTTKITGTNLLEFNSNSATKVAGAGTIGYDVYGAPGLSIVGGGETAASRKLTLWAEGGTTFKGPINFGTAVGENLVFYDAPSGADLAMGVMNQTMYSRVPTGQTFRWYDGGSYSLDPESTTNGRSLAKLNHTGFTLQSGVFTGNGSGLTNLNPNSLPTSYNYLGITGNNFLEFGKDVPGKQRDNGKIGYDTFGANYGFGLSIVGAGTDPYGADRKITLHSEGGLNVFGNIIGNRGLSLTGGRFDFGSRLGAMMGAFGEMIAVGAQNHTLYFRAPHNFAWYKDGVHNDASIDEAGHTGGGTALAYLDSKGLRIPNGSVTLGQVSSGFGFNVSTLNFPASNWAIVSSTINNSGLNFNRNGSTVGYVDYVGDYRRNSDLKLKTDIKEVTGALDGLMKLRPTSYRFKTEAEDAPKSFGFIAQEVQEVFPNIVGHSDKDTLALSYDSFIPVTVAAVQEQQKQIETLSTENGDLKKRLSDLEEKLEKLVDQLPAAPASEDSIGGK